MDQDHQINGLKPKRPSFLVVLEPKRPSFVVVLEPKRPHDFKVGIYFINNSSGLFLKKWSLTSREIIVVKKPTHPQVFQKGRKTKDFQGFTHPQQLPTIFIQNTPFNGPRVGLNLIPGLRHNKPNGPTLFLYAAICEDSTY